MTSIVVFVEQAAGAPRRASLEALSAAKAAGGEVTAVVTGPGAEAAAGKLGAFGAARVVALTGAEHFSPDGTAADVAAVAGEVGAKVCLAAASSAGKDVMPRVAALLDSTPFTDCTGFALEGGSASAVRPMLAGKVVASVTSSGPVFCATLRPNTFKAEETGGSAEAGPRAIHVQWRDVAGNWSIPVVLEAHVLDPDTTPTPADL